MAKRIATMVLFTIFLNLSAGLLIPAVVTNTGKQVFNPENTGFKDFNNSNDYADEFKSGMEENIKPAGSTEDKGDQIYRVLDTMKLGFAYRFINIIDRYMYGFINVLDSVVGSALDDNVRAILFGNTDDDDLIPNRFGAFKIVITIGYILFGINLFTGKDITGETYG